MKKGSYPLYLHCYTQKDFEGEDSAVVKITVEGIKDCYLNKSNDGKYVLNIPIKVPENNVNDGKLVVNKTYKESSYLRNIIDNKLKYAEIDKIDLRNSKSLKEIEKLKDVEHLVLANIKQSERN